jgi:hypothetical protein
MVVDMGNHLIWRSQDMSEERSRSCSLHTDQVPGGVETKLDESFQDAYRQLAAAMVDDVLSASGLLLVWFLGMMWGTCEHLLEKIGSILVTRSSGTRLWTGGIAAGQNWQTEKGRVYLDSIEWERGGECLGDGVVW